VQANHAASELALLCPPYPALVLADLEPPAQPPERNYWRGLAPTVTVLCSALILALVFGMAASI
jgi:hypothetical protein